MTEKVLSRIMAEKKVLVCIGAGGVGKTTVSAALGLRAAQAGRSALVCTIDPAKRLANSLGLQTLGNTETRVSIEALNRAGLPEHAPLYAMMLDMKRSWDELIEQRVSEEKRQRILENRFYQSLSTALAGSQEYIAMEKLCQLRRNRNYDLIVLDTPPTVHALDFLDAPERLLNFLDNDFARVFLTPALTAGKLGLKLFNFGSSYMTGALAKLAGMETLQELGHFLLSIESMNEDFRQRAKQTREMLTSTSTAFVLVTAAARERLDEAANFVQLLKKNNMNLAAIVVNRVHEPTSQPIHDLVKQLEEPVRSKMLTTLEESNILAAQDAEGIALIRSFSGTIPIVQIPRFTLDVHELKSLWQTSQYLTGDLTVSVSTQDHVLSQ